MLRLLGYLVEPDHQYGDAEHILQPQQEAKGPIRRSEIDGDETR